LKTITSTLADLAENIVVYNNKQSKIRFQLEIYTQTAVTKEMKNLLHDSKQVFLLGKVSMEELDLIYDKSDILLHVESFDLKQKLITRLSFSTKIIDLVHSGRTLLFKYLKGELSLQQIARIVLPE
jgi:hypothetical protein